jgi:ABC-type sugar transport system ATPase subunit
MAEIALTGLSKKYADGTVAVADLTLTVADGEFLVLVGPSGCGKSTVLRGVAGLETPSAGTITLGGRRVEHLPSQARDLAMVFQSYALCPHMKVYDNLAFGLKMWGVPREEIRDLELAADPARLHFFIRRTAGGFKKAGGALLSRPTYF